MKIIHIGPRLARGGGPAGYLLELRQAASASPSASHAVSFPPVAPKAEERRRDVGTRRFLGRWKRELFGPPRQKRPSLAELAKPGGPVAELIAAARERGIAACSQSLEELSRASTPADVLFVHDPYLVDEARRRGRGAAVWLMIHSPMPLAHYLAWNWALPEADWRDIASLPDVRSGIETELRTWEGVERVVLPCPEALEELTRFDPRFGESETPVELLLTGCGNIEPRPPNGDRWKLPSNEHVGLFLGNAQAYRGLDVLIDAVRLLPDRRKLPGVVAVAGPDPGTLPRHARLKRLGRVDDVAGVLASVDFVINTNRFSLFDLSNVEAAAAGKPLLLHAVGGNKTIARLGAGCRLFTELTPETLARALSSTFSMGREELRLLGERSRSCYLRELTAEKMWRRHLELYDRATWHRLERSAEHS